MGIELTEKHNQTASGLVNFFSVLVESELPDCTFADLVSIFGIISGRELLKNTLGDKFAEHEQGIVVLTAEVSETTPNYIDFLLWLGQALQFPSPEKKDLQLSHERLAILLAFIKTHQSRIETIFSQGNFPRSDYPFIALLASVLAYDRLKDNNFSFSDAVSFIIYAFIYGSKIT